MLAAFESIQIACLARATLVADPDCPVHGTAFGRGGAGKPA